MLPDSIYSTRVENAKDKALLFGIWAENSKIAVTIDEKIVLSDKALASIEHYSKDIFKILAIEIANNNPEFRNEVFNNQFIAEVKKIVKNHERGNTK